MRAEIPEGVERFTTRWSKTGRRASDGEWLRAADLPKLYQHWLEQFSEAVLSDEAIQIAIDAAIGGHIQEGQEVPCDEIDFDAAFRAALDKAQDLMEAVARAERERSEPDLDRMARIVIERVSAAALDSLTKEGEGR